MDIGLLRDSDSKMTAKMIGHKGFLRYLCMCRVGPLVAYFIRWGSFNGRDSSLSKCDFSRGAGKDLPQVCRRLHNGKARLRLICFAIFSLSENPKSSAHARPSFSFPFPFPFPFI